ncbi:MAG TPA: 50S ribosomal protein L17 [Candidatus Omnitrophica bacterium]|nr:50S ribosomal protein L17 [Candidatus Omnitrophota bacterium]HCI44819.1 50S ribosomal protein L17 [Candidatus Omnitrophota bacterium]
MRHGMAGNRLSRNSSLRKATVRDLAKATLVAQRICTTEARAKEARKLVDKLITLGKKGTLAAKRRAFSILTDHKVVSDLFVKTSPRFKDRVGGYTRIIKLGTRRGDNAALAYLELTEKEIVIVSKPKSAAAVKKEKAPAVHDHEHHGHEHPGHEHHGHEHHEPAHEHEAKPKPKAVIKEQPKKDAIKDQKSLPDKDKPRGKFMGGIRNMFNRGSSSSGK